MIATKTPRLITQEKTAKKSSYFSLTKLSKRPKKRITLEIKNHNSQCSLYEDKSSKLLAKFAKKNNILDDKQDRIREKKLVPQQKLENVFNKLVEQWKRETRGISSTTELILNPAYQQIIGMGKDVIPLLLRELEKKSGRWFWALKSITREDPVSPETKGKTQAMIDIWLDWGRKNGYQW